MMIWKISQRVNNDYDTYSDAVVVATDAETARRIHPGGEYGDLYTWAAPEDVTVELLGVAMGDAPAGVVVASFHAG